jgi:archaeal flagellin FlaB
MVIFSEAIISDYVAGDRTADLPGESVMIDKTAKAVDRLRRGQAGMTGLQTAILLIAFSTVAAVFGYAVLNAGLYSAERGKETVYAGLQQARANMEIAGSVIVESDNTDAVAILFTVRNAIAGAPIDMTPNDGATANKNRCILSLTTAEAYFNNIPWKCSSIGTSDGDNLLEPGEQMEIVIDLTGAWTANETTGAWAPIGVNDWFNIQVKPTQGSTMTVQRTLPAGLDPIMDMH